MYCCRSFSNISSNTNENSSNWFAHSDLFRANQSITQTVWRRSPMLSLATTCPFPFQRYFLYKRVQLTSSKCCYLLLLFLRHFSFPVKPTLYPLTSVRLVDSHTVIGIVTMDMSSRLLLLLQASVHSDSLFTAVRIGRRPSDTDPTLFGNFAASDLL